MKWAIEQDAARVAALELQRRRALLASLGSAQREAVTRIAHRVAEHIADCLVTGAQSDQRLFHALRTIYVPSTP